MLPWEMIIKSPTINIGPHKYLQTTFFPVFLSVYQIHISLSMNSIASRMPMLAKRPSQVRCLSTQLGKLTSFPTSIRPSVSELENSRLSPQNLEIAMYSLHCDGLVVVEDVIPHDCLNQLNEKMVADAYVLQAKKEDGPFNYNPGNIQQDAPPVRKHFDPKIFMSEWTQPII